jgi:hypothetical protein
MGIVEEADLKVYQAKFGVSDEQMEDQETLVGSLADKSILTKKRTRSKYHTNREVSAKTHFVDMLNQVDEHRKVLEEMTEEERIAE